MIIVVMMKTNMKVMVVLMTKIRVMMAMMMLIGMKMEKGGDLPVTGSCTVRHSRPPTDMFANFTWSLAFRIVIIIIVIIIAIKKIIITFVIGIIVLISNKIQSST